MNNYGFDMFGNPINIGVYGVDEHQMMHQSPNFNAYNTPHGGMGNPGMQGMYPNHGMYPQQMPYAPQGMYPQQPQNARATTKKDIIIYIQNLLKPSSTEQVVEFDTLRTRHICQGFKEIVLLDKQIVQVPTSKGILCVEIFFCQRCRKLLINSQSLDFM